MSKRVQASMLSASIDGLCSLLKLMHYRETSLVTRLVTSKVLVMGGLVMILLVTTS